MKDEPKKKRGRPAQDKTNRGYTIDRVIAEYIDSLDEGKRSDFVNEWLKRHPQIIELLKK